MSRLKLTMTMFLALGLVAAAIVGCGRGVHPAHSGWTTGYIEPTHAKPIGSGYYTDWDPYAGTVVLDRVEDTGPVGTDQIFVVTVLDKDGKPLPNRRVEWILAEGSVGDIIEVDESGIRKSRGYKIDSKYAVSHSGNYDHVFDRGTDDPSDDLVLGEGQTWCVLSSPIEGDSFLMAYVPAIYDWNEQKKMMKYHWRDFESTTLSSGSACAGSAGLVTTHVKRHSNGEPLEGYEVTYRIVDGVAAKFDNGERQIMKLTDENGIASATLEQTAGITGVNNIHVDVVRPGNDACCREPLHMASATVEQSWMAPSISLTKSIPSEAKCGKETTILLNVSNPSACDASDVIVKDMLPVGLELVSSSPEADVSGKSLSWSFGTLAAGASRDIELRVQANDGGEFGSEAIAMSSNEITQQRAWGELIIRCPALALTLEAPREVTNCDPVAHTLVVRNDGNGEARNVIVEVDIAEGLTPESGSNRQRFEIGSLAAGESRSLSLMARPQRTGEFATKAKAFADDGLEADALVSTLVTGPALELARTGPKQRFIGREATYEITVRNTGDAVAESVVLNESVPAGMEFVKSTGGGRFSEGKVVWNLEALPPGAVRTVSHTLRAVHSGAAEAQITASSVCGDATLREVTQIEGIAALLLEVVDIDDPIEIGKDVTYEIRVTNQGSADAKGISLVATLPPEMSYVKSDGPTNASVDGQQVRFGLIEKLAPQKQAVYQLKARANQAGDVRFNVKMTTEESKVPVQESESTFLY